MAIYVWFLFVLTAYDDYSPMVRRGKWREHLQNLTKAIDYVVSLWAQDAHYPFFARGETEKEKTDEIQH